MSPQTVREIASNLSKLRSLVADTRKDLLQIRNLHNALEEMLVDLWTDHDIQKLAASQTAWKEFTSIVASGRIPSLAAQANDSLSDSTQLEHDWLCSGTRYSQWLGRGVATLARAKDAELQRPQDWKPLAELCGRAFTIGYTADVVSAIVTSLALEENKQQHLKLVVKYLAKHEQRKFLLATLTLISRSYLPPSFSMAFGHWSTAVEGSAALFKLITSACDAMVLQSLVEWLVQGSVYSVALTQAVISVLPLEERTKALERVWQTFVDKLYIKHTPIMQQEALLRVLLLLAGATHQVQPMQVFVLAHSSLHTEGISNRLSASTEKARILGTFLGTLISGLVDKPDTRMTFSFDEYEKRELQEFRALISLSFKIGSVNDLRTLAESSSKQVTTLVARPKIDQVSNTATTSRPLKSNAKIAIIEEINDEPGEDDDLPVYAKPDSDAEASDPEDTSLSRRTKPKAPVYIRDLLTQLSNSDDADAHILALRAAPGLIRRKAAFGSELRDQALGLAAAYANLQDTLGLEGWLDLRLDGLTALIAACPQDVGPWLAVDIFVGDYSISTRNTLLTAMGLAGRALAEGPSTKQDGQFPSRTLPDRLHEMYAAEAEQTILARRLDADSMAIPARKRSHSARLAHLIPPTLFFPLTAGTHAHLQGRAAALARTTLPTLLQTLALLLTHAGPGAPARADMAVELWDMALAVRARAASGSALEAVLFALLGALNALGDQRRVAIERGPQLLETQVWVEAVLEQLEGAGVLGDEEKRARSLAAGAAFACKEIVDQYNRLLLGDMVNFK